MDVILQGVPGIMHGYIDDILVTGEMSVDQLVLCQQITAEDGALNQPQRISLRVLPNSVSLIQPYGVVQSFLAVSYKRIVATKGLWLLLTFSAYKNSVNFLVSL